MMKLHLKEHCKLLPDLISPVLAKDHQFFCANWRQPTSDCNPWLSPVAFVCYLHICLLVSDFLTLKGAYQRNIFIPRHPAPLFAGIIPANHCISFEP